MAKIRPIWSPWINIGPCRINLCNFSYKNFRRQIMCFYLKTLCTPRPYKSKLRPFLRIQRSLVDIFGLTFKISWSATLTWTGNFCSTWRLTDILEGRQTRAQFFVCFLGLS
jgi:hypothetical protein